MKNKRGPWSKNDKDYMAENCDNMSHVDIGEKLQRNPDAILNYLKKTGLISSGTKKMSAQALHVEYDIKKTPHWPILQQQFSPQELNDFLYHWNNIIKQFRDDVVHTEELQIVDMIKLEILMNRLLIQEQEVETMIDELGEQNNIEKRKPPSEKDRELIFEVDRQIANLMTSKTSINTQYREMLKEKNKSLDKLKATREARVKDIESIKTTMTGWVRELILKPELRNQWGKQMEKERIASNVEFERLSEYHEYADGMVDQPFLTPENTKGGK
jgi:hypothetical protein